MEVTAACRWRIANWGHFLDFAILLLCSVMCDLAVLFIHLITTIVRLAGPGGARSVVAESVLVKQQLLILNRSRHRSPNLRVCDERQAGNRTEQWLSAPGLSIFTLALE